VIVHHIISDAASALVFLTTFEYAYNRLHNNKNIIEPIFNERFTEAFKKERLLLSEDFNAKAKKYWLDFINDIPLKVSLPYQSGVNISQAGSRIGKSIFFEFNAEDLSKLKKFSKKNKSTIFITVSAVFGMALSKYTDQEKILLSYPTNMRPPGFKNISGCFVNNLPLKIDLTKNNTLNELIYCLRNQRKEAKHYQGYSLTRIIQDKREATGINSTDFFNIGVSQTSLNVLNLNLSGVDVKPLDITENYDSISEISLCYDEYSSDVIRFKFEYRKELFDEQVMNNFVSLFKNIIIDAISEKDITISDYPALTSNDFKKVVYDWNNTNYALPESMAIFQLFENEAENNPDIVAVVCGKDKLTYLELNQKANQLARHIEDMKMHDFDSASHRTDDYLICVYLGNEIDTIVSIIAILKSGCAYVPLDVSEGIERTNNKLLSINATNIITNNRNISKLKSLASLNINIMNVSCIEKKYDFSNLEKNIKTKSLAYGIYTSGSTGTPKVSTIRHDSFLNLNSWYGDTFKFNSNSRVIVCSSFCFDLTQKNYFTTLSKGGTIYLPRLSENSFDIVSIVEMIIENDINMINCSPSSFGLIIDRFSKLKLEDKCNFNYVFLGGEPLSKTLVEKVNSLRVCDYLVNTYGPSECTDVTTYCELNLENYNVFPIGKPIRNVKHYVLNTNLDPVPIGVIGELYIGGICVGNGYLGNDQLNNEVFIQNPFLTTEDSDNKLIYKTGDLVRWLPDGNLEYIERRDFQVKINGHRIELGDIEQNISNYGGIKQAVVLCKKEDFNHLSGQEVKSRKYLLAYYVRNNHMDNQSINVTKESFESSLIAYLKEVLPGYMIPNHFIEVDRFRLTSNGKLDKKALPEPVDHINKNYLAPKNDIEYKLCKLWKDALFCEEVGVRDDFFSMGGDSITAIELTQRMNALLVDDDICFDVSDLFKYSTIESLLISLLVKDNSDSLIKELSSIDKKLRNLYFIHPGIGGCEIYRQLANRVKLDFNSYGIDNFNMLNSHQIENLNLLAKEYVNHLPKFNINSEVNLCGWSLGGQIALEMAYILEKKGFLNINVYLLDTVIQDEYLNDDSKCEPQENLDKKISDYLLSKGHDKRYVRKAMTASKSEKKIRKQELSGLLKSTKILLFKASNEDKRISYKGRNEKFVHIKNLVDNNVGKYAKQLKVISLDCDHGNILDYFVKNNINPFAMKMPLLSNELELELDTAH
tara:strand:- start:428 stop:4072 length:3645 start_codon:yes stop_codon:yes gene_type:complete